MMMYLAETEKDGKLLDEDEELLMYQINDEHANASKLVGSFTRNYKQQQPTNASPIFLHSPFTANSGTCSR